MKLYFYLLSILFLVCCSPVGREEGGPIEAPEDFKAAPAPAHRIVKSSNIQEILKHIDNESLVVFDVDATLVWVPGHTWPYQNVQTCSLAEGENTASMWQALLKATSNHTTEKGAKFIALTARITPKNQAQGAHNDLNAVGLTASYAWVNAFNPGPSYQNGVLYASHGDKGKLLKAFIRAARTYYPFKKVIFIDDRMNNVTSVHNQLKLGVSGIESSLCFWYQGAIHPDLKTTIGWNFWPVLPAGSEEIKVVKSWRQRDCLRDNSPQICQTPSKLI